jgi:hypothetical protein
MPHLSFARIMYGTSEGLRGDSGLSSFADSSRSMVSIHSGSSATQGHGRLTLESLLQKAWQALSFKH